MHESLLVVLLDGNDLNNPAGQVSHCGCTVAEPAVFVYLPAGHLVWAPHHSKGQPLSDIYKGKLSVKVMLVGSG